MRSGSTVSLVSTASQEYWNRWGKQWLAVVTSFDPQPNEILLVSNIKAELPDNIRQIPTIEPFIWESFNHGMREAVSDYVGFLGLDDVMPVDAFRDLVLEGDVLVSSYIDSKKDIHTPTKDRWLNCLNDEHFTLDGYRIVHRDIAHLIPHRPIPWADWAASLEYYQHQLDVRFEDRIRYFYNLHDDQQSRPADHQKAKQQIDLVRKMVLNGGVKPGSCFPPEPLQIM